MATEETKKKKGQRVDQAHELVRPLMEPHEANGHGYSHILAVFGHAQASVKEAKLEKYEEESVLLAVLCHELTDPKLFESEPTREANWRRIMSELEMDTKQADLVREMVDLVSCSKNGNTPVEPPWKLIPRDCDRLEAIGLVGIVRTLQYSVSIGSPFFTATTPRVTSLEELQRIATPERFAEYKGKSASCIDHFYDKLVHIGTFHSRNPYIERMGAQRLMIMHHFLFLHGAGVLDYWTAHVSATPKKTTS